MTDRLNILIKSLYFVPFRSFSAWTESPVQTLQELLLEPVGVRYLFRVESFRSGTKQVKLILRSKDWAIGDLKTGC